MDDEWNETTRAENSQLEFAAHTATFLCANAVAFSPTIAFLYTSVFHNTRRTNVKKNSTMIEQPAGTISARKTKTKLLQA